MILSAICVIAFAGSAIASNEVNEKFEAVASETPCADQWSADYNFYRSKGGLSPEAAIEAANCFFDACLERTYNNNPDATCEVTITISRNF